MKKILLPGQVRNFDRLLDLFITITLTPSQLCITGVIDPKANGDSHGPSGQLLLDGHLSLETLYPGWTPEMVGRLFQIWDEYHLNNMQAGSPAQMAVVNSLPRNTAYEGQVKALAEAGLLIDQSYLHNGKPYRYGTAWLRIEVPEDVMKFIETLPAAKKEMPVIWRE